MKTRLLRKIRKQYDIIYYPLGVPLWDFKKDVEYFYSKKYSLIDKNNAYFTCFRFTKEDCLDVILTEVRKKYSHLGSKNKKKKETNKGIKVWYIKK